MINGKPKSELPEKEPNIYGRTKEIESIVQVLSVDSGENVAGVLVTGAAGVGKSTVAVHAGHWIKNEFEAIVKYCSLRGTYKAGESLDEDVLREIFNVGVPGHQQGSEFPRYVLLNWCRQLKNEMILIVDNVDHAIEVRRSKYDLFNLLSDMRMCSDWKLKFLLTSSRDIEAVETDSNIQLRKIYLDALDVEESIKVLKNGAQLTSNNDPKTEFSLPKIAELCENNPLALRLAGSLLAESEYTFEVLQQKLEQNPIRTLRIMPMMKIAFEQLDENLQRALVCLSVFPRSFKRDAAEAVLGDDCAEALTNLKKRCLIQKQGDRYLIHLLIRSYTKQIGEERQEFGQILADGKQYCLRHFLSLLLRNAQNYWGKNTCKESLKLFNDERVNLEFTLKEVAGGQKNVQNSKELEGVVNACSQVAPYIDGCVPFKLSVDFGYGVLQFSQSQKNVTKQVEILCFLYDAARRHGGDMEQSKGLIDEAFKQYKSNPQLFEQNSLSEALFLSQYGRYLSQDLDKRDEAQPFLQKALTIVSKETVEHPSTFGIGRVLGQMGHNARLGKRDNDNLPKEALNYFQRALNFHQCHYGEHVVIALAHKDLAGIYMSVDDFAKAEENYDAAVRMFECLGMMKKKEVIQFRPLKTLQDVVKRVERLTKLEENSRWRLKLLIPLSREITNGKLRSTPIWH